MRTLLNVNGEWILNLMDLKENFSPAELFQNLNSFRSFAKVHCKLLKTCYLDPETKKKYAAKYIVKDFWYDLLTRSQWPEEADPQKLLDLLLRELAAASTPSSGNEADPEEAVRKEASDGALAEKLSAILGGGVKDARSAILMLAISELAEVDARTVSSGEWSQSKDDASLRKPEGFGYRDTAYLAPSKVPYRFLAHEGGPLGPGEVIRTVKLAAKAGSGKFPVKIELWKPSGNAPEAEARLAPGEYRYCTAVGDRVIKFLPSLCVSDDLCAVRADYGGQNIRVKPRDGEEWELQADNVSSMSAGSGGRGLLLVQNGRPNSVFFRDAEDFFVRLKLDAVAKTVVEARVTEDGFELLLEDGSTVTGGSTAPRTGLTSLDGMGPRPSGLVGARECAVSRSGRSAAAILEEGKYRVFAGGFSVENGGRTVRFQ